MKEIALLGIGIGIGYMYCKARMEAAANKKEREAAICTHCKGTGKEPAAAK
jgi:hypothetical protein